MLTYSTVPYLLTCICSNSTQPDYGIYLHWTRTSYSTPTWLLYSPTTCRVLRTVRTLPTFFYKRHKVTSTAQAIACLLPPPRNTSPPFAPVTVDTHDNVTDHQANAQHATTNLWHPALKKQTQSPSPPEQATTAVSKILPHTHHRPTQPPAAAVAASSHRVPALEVSASQTAPVEGSSSKSPLPLGPLTLQSSSNWQSNSKSPLEEKHRGSTSQAFLTPDLSEEDFLPSFAAASPSSSPSAFPPSSSTVPLLAPSSSSAAVSSSTAAPPTYSEKEKNKSLEAQQQQQQQQPDSEPPPPYTETICPLQSFTFNMSSAGSIITQVQQGAPQLTLAGTGYPILQRDVLWRANSRRCNWGRWKPYPGLEVCAYIIIQKYTAKIGVNVNYRGTQFNLTREELLTLPEFVLLSLFPNGIFPDGGPSSFHEDIYTVDVSWQKPLHFF